MRCSTCVPFDEKGYDIVIDGQPRQSHCKGGRAILYSVFTIGLLKHCVSNEFAPFGLVVIDSPLTCYKKKGATTVSCLDKPITAGVEAGFWQSLTQLPKSLQVIIIENKEPPSSVVSKIHYEWFAGENAVLEESAALIPVSSAHSVSSQTFIWCFCF